jgi:D-alanine-D-alanine ligase-like ATP-grasp enzyme
MVLATGGHIMGADILTDQTGKLWALECNSVPGFDPSSDVAQRWVRWLDRALLA